MNIVVLDINAQLKSLLQRCELPTDDLSGVSSPEFFGIELDGQLVGCVGIERLGDVGLLRSLAVLPGYRQRSIGTALVKHAEAEAKRLGVNDLFLLTNSAPGYFAQMGYGNADRQQAPNAIKSTAQFANLCPASAKFMVKSLLQNPAASLPRSTSV